MGVGNLPVMMSKSCLVPFAFALMNPAAPGSTWHSAQVTSRCGDMAYAFSSGSMVWHMPQNAGVSENPTALTPPIVAAAPNPPKRTNRRRMPLLLRQGGWGILWSTRPTGANNARTCRK